MLGPRNRRLARRMQREPEECQAADPGKRLLRLCLRGHTAAEGLAARNERQPRRGFAGRGNRRTDRRLSQLRRIRPFALSLRKRKLVPQRRDAERRELIGHGDHERVPHACSRAVRKHETPFSVWRPQQQARDASRVINGDRHGFGNWRCHSLGRSRELKLVHARGSTARLPRRLSS